jgi:hypothetical protein
VVVGAAVGEVVSHAVVILEELMAMEECTEVLCG